MNRAARSARTDEVKLVGKSGQISLGKRLAGKRLRVEFREDGSILLTCVLVVPESELWTLEEPHRSRINRGLAWAAQNPPEETDLASLTKKAGSSTKARRHAARK